MLLHRYSTFLQHSLLEALCLCCRCHAHQRESCESQVNLNEHVTLDVLQCWRGAVEERREGRERLQKLATVMVLGEMAVVPTSLRLPQRPAAAVALGVLTRWRSHCQVDLCRAYMPCLTLVAFCGVPSLHSVQPASL